MVLSSSLAACGSGGGGGSCSVDEAAIGPSGWDWSTNTYCSTQDQCQQYCNAAMGHDAVRNCHWDTSAASFCSGDLPSSPPQVCALSLTVTCGGTPGDPSVNCWNCDNITPGASDYDPGTDCTSQWGTSVGMAPACADAIAQVQ